MTNFEINAEFEQNNEVQVALEKYSAAVKEITAETFEEIEGLPTYYTCDFDVEELDGHPITVSYSYHPEGMDGMSTLRYSTIITDTVPDAGQWVKNYHVHELASGQLAWEKREWFVTDAKVKEAFQKGVGTAALSHEVEGVTSFADMNLADQKAATARIHEALSTVGLEQPTLNEVAMLQSYIDNL